MSKIEKIKKELSNLKDIERDIRRDIKDIEDDLYGLEKKIKKQFETTDPKKLKKIKEKLEKEIIGSYEDLKENKLYQKYAEEF